jgi:hypothetical protein
MTASSHLSTVAPPAELDWAARIPHRPAPPAEPAGSHRWTRPWARTGTLVWVERVLAFVLPLVALEIAAFLLAVKYHSVVGDAASRLANGSYVFFSRDPHLAAIGFVWNPLTSVSEMPLMLLKGFWPALTRDELAASMTSSIFMAGAAYQFYRFMEDLSVRRVVRWLLFACFICNPMMFYFGANGMSEALFTFTLVGCARYFALWLHDGRLRALVISGLWLAFSYATRNEAAMSAVLATAVVLVVSYARSPGQKRVRRSTALCDAILFVMPFLLSFGGWAVVSYVIVGHLFEQFSSVYGTSSQLTAVNSGLKHLPSKLEEFKTAVGAVVSYGPLIPLAAVGAGIRSWLDRDLRVLAVLTIPGGVVFFEVAAYSTGHISASYRYFIYAVPLTLMLVACLARPLPKRELVEPADRIQAIRLRDPRHLTAVRRRRLIGSALIALLAVVLAVPGLLTTGWEMAKSSLFDDDRPHLAYIFNPQTKWPQAVQYRQEWYADVAAAQHFDNMRLHNGAIMVDNFDPCMPQVILAAHDPKEFIIPNDEDFTPKLGAPYQNGIRFMIVPAPNAYNDLNAVTREYPSLYADGAGIAKLAWQFNLSECGTFRLYQLTPSST